MDDTQKLEIGPALKALIGELVFRVATLETENDALRRGLAACRQEHGRVTPIRQEAGSEPA